MLDLFGLVVALIVALVATAYWYHQGGRAQETTPPSTAENHAAGEPSSASSPARKKKKKKTAPTQKRGSKPAAPSAKHPRFLRRFGGHSGNIVAMSVSPNGEWMATAGTDGQIRVTKVEQQKSDLYLRTNVESRGMGVFQDHISALSWSADLRTLVGTTKHSHEIAFYRIRRKKDAATTSTSHFPYELAELPKRRFATKMHDTIGSCLVDPHSNFCLVVTNCGETSEHGNTVAWDGAKGEVVGTLTTCGVGIRLSPDGRFLCGRGGSSEVKVYEVHRKKIKGEVEPVFDRITPKSVMTLVSRRSKVADVAFVCGGSENDSCNKAVVGCVDGSIQLWSLDVEYRLREDPKLLCSTHVLAGKEIMCVAASSVGNINRIAVATNDSALHILTYNSTQSISLDFSIERTHAEGIGDVQFCPVSGKVVYTRGRCSKDVFAWTVE